LSLRQGCESASFNGPLHDAMSSMKTGDRDREIAALWRINSAHR
jgi:hypothetical protein